MNFTMFLKFIILGILSLIEEILSIKENNNIKINITSSKELFKKQIGCVPAEKWSIMKQGHNSDEGACKTKDYDVNDPPRINIDHLMASREEQTFHMTHLLGQPMSRRVFGD